jgi:hypothetical protein
MTISHHDLPVALTQDLALELLGIDPHQRTASEAELDRIRAQFNPQSISPLEIDDFLTQLFEAGVETTPAIARLLTLGAKFNHYIWNTLNEVHDVGIAFDENQPVNVLRAAGFQARITERTGKDPQSWLQVPELFTLGSAHHLDEHDFQLVG